MVVASDREVRPTLGTWDAHALVAGFIHCGVIPPILSPCCAVYIMVMGNTPTCQGDTVYLATR
jgi:hypothetical protein